MYPVSTLFSYLVQRFQYVDENILHIKLVILLILFVNRHLFDSANRETYESSHSVMLAIFASHAQKASEGGKGKNEESGTQPFAEQVVPFYARCLIEVGF